MMTNLKTRMLLTVAIALLGACSNSGAGGLDIRFDMGSDGTADIGIDSADAATYRDAGSNDSGIDATNESDSGGDFSPTAPWIFQDVSCERGVSTITYPTGPELATPIVDAPPIRESLSKELVRSKFPEGFPSPGGVYLATTDTEAIFTSARGWVIVAGEPTLTLRIAPFTGDPLEPSLRLTMTALMNYRPIEQATWSLMNAAETGFESTVESSGVSVRFDEQIELLEIQIPYSAFEGSGYNELVLFFNLSTPETNYYQSGKRFAIWNGSTQMPSHPCFEEGPEPAEKTDLERSLPKIDPFQTVILYPASKPNAEGMQGLNTAAPGETVAIQYFIEPRKLYFTGERRAVIMPLLDGRPLQDEFRYVIPKAGVTRGGDDPLFETVFRGEFDVTLPEEPGVYEVDVGVISDAFIPMTWPNGVIRDDVSKFVTQVSNKLRFEVRE